MKVNHAAYKSQIQQVCEALTKKFGARHKLPVDGGEHEIADVVKILKDSVAHIAAVDALRAHLTQAVQAQRDSQGKARQLLLALERYLQGVLGPRNPALLEFGFKPLGKRAKSSATKAAAAEKARATREARHTMGARERKMIVGMPSGDEHAPANGAVKNGVNGVNGASA